VSVDRYLEGQDVPDVAENLKEGSQQGTKLEKRKNLVVATIALPHI